MTDKPKKTRKPRVDSAQGVACAIVAGGKKIAIPAHIKFAPKERLVFTEICGEFSKSELSAHKITLIAGMAKQIASLEEEQLLLRNEGSVLTNSHGNAVTNPRVKICSQLTASVLSMRRSLGIHTRALEGGGDNRNAAVRRAHNKANETMLDEIDEEGLLNRPPNVLPFRPVEDDDDA